MQTNERIRFLTHFDIAPTGCWEWKAAIVRGYGKFKTADRKMAAAHRYAYEMLRGPIPEGLVIDHLCRNTICVNPDHLEPVTWRENTLRGVSRPALNAVKTHCKRGHEFTPENTYEQTVGGRGCKLCRRVHTAAYRARKGQPDLRSPRQ